MKKIGKKALHCLFIFFIYMYTVSAPFTTIERMKQLLFNLIFHELYDSTVSY